MAYTQHKLHIRDGKSSCYLVDPIDRTNSAPHDNPMTAANLPRVLFHSDLPYYEVIVDQSLTWTLPSRAPADAGSGGEEIWNGAAAGIYQYADHYPFGTVSLPAIPRGFLMMSGAYVLEPVVVQTYFVNVNLGTVKRLIAPALTTSGLCVREYWQQMQNQAWTWPAINLAVVGKAFKKVTPTAGAALIKFNGATGSFQFGRLLIDAARNTRLMRKVAAGQGLPVTADRTIDMSSGGVRIWNPANGTYSDIGSYTGSYAGPTLGYIA